MTAVPPPVRSSARLYCPWHFEEKQHGGFGWAICYWRRQDSRRALRAYRRHWRKRHA